MADYEKDPNSPGYHRPEHAQHEAHRELVRDVCAGTLRLREKAATYLPKHTAEHADEWKLRIGRAVLFNVTLKTLDTLVGIAFKKEPQLGKDVPEATQLQLKDCDLAGTHWAVFLKLLFRDVMQDGLAGILVDMPPALPEGATLADEQAAGLRPYFVKYTADQIVNWRTNEKGQLTLLVLEEESTEPVGAYGVGEVCRYRVLTPGAWEVWREVEDENTKQKKLIPEVNPDGSPMKGTTLLPVIPFAPAYARKDGVMQSAPPLLELANLNLRHFQDASDYSTSLYVGSNPLMFFSGVSSDFKLESTGPYAYVKEQDPLAKAIYLEVSGAAYSAVSANLKDLIDQMQALVLSLRVSNFVQKTATEDRQDALREESYLATAVRGLRDCTELALWFVALYSDRNAITGGTVELGADLDDVPMTSQELQVLHQSVAAGIHTKETVWKIEASAGVLPQDFDPKAEAAALQAEKQAAMDAAAQAFNGGFVA